MTVADIAWPPGPAASTQQAIPVFWGLDAIPENLGPTVLTLGVFDGVHRGHARLINRAVGVARRHELPLVLVTFDPHPARVLGRQRDTSTLTTIPRRAALAAELGVDAVVVLPFDRALASRTPKDFVDQVLADRLHARAVVVGANFTFGVRGAGTVEALTELGAAQRFATHGVDLLQGTEVPCSSTYIRACLRRGDVTAAAAALGRPHQVAGDVRGQLITVPEGTALPAPGTYRAVLTPERSFEARAAGRRSVDVEIRVADSRHLEVTQVALAPLPPSRLSVAFVA